MLGSRLPLLWWVTIPRPRASGFLSFPAPRTFKCGSRVNSRDSPRPKKSLLAGYNPVGLHFSDELQEKLLIVTGPLRNASHCRQTVNHAVSGTTRVRQVFWGSLRKLHNHCLPKGSPANSFGNRGNCWVFREHRFFYGFFIIWLSVFYIRQPFCSGAPNDGFLLNALKTLFWLSRVLLDLLKCILREAVKFVSVRSS